MPSDSCSLIMASHFSKFILPFETIFVNPLFLLLLKISFVVTFRTFAQFATVFGLHMHTGQRHGATQHYS